MRAAGKLGVVPGIEEGLDKRQLLLTVSRKYSRTWGSSSWAEVSDGTRRGQKTEQRLSFQGQLVLTRGGR